MRLGVLTARRGRSSLAVMLGLSVGLLSCASAAAGANAPAWRVTALSLPTNLPPGGTGQVQLQIFNIGDAPTDGSPVTVVDHLPAGVIATAAGALVVQGGGGLEVPGPWGNGKGSGEECAGVGTSTVTCTYEAGAIDPVSYFSPGYNSENVFGEKNAGQAAAIGINVEVKAPAGETLSSEATVSGGGVPVAASAITPMVISSTPAPFGLARFAQSSTNVDGTPDTQAGSHPYETTTSFFLNSSSSGARLTPSGGEMKDLHLDLPAGFVGNPSATPKCPREAFDQRLEGGQIATPNCPSDTQVGVVLVYLEPTFLIEPAVYNLVPPAGVPAQFAFAFQEKLGFIDASLRTGGGYNASVDVRNIVQQGVLGATVTLWGDPSDPSHDELRYVPFTPHSAGSVEVNGERGHIPFGGQPRPFLTLPTSCGSQQTLSVSLDSWETALERAQSVPPTAFASSDAQGKPVPVNSCERLDFNPSISLQPDSGSAESPTGLAVDLKVPQTEDPAGLAEAHLKEAVVRLPAGMTVSPSAANGLGACTLEEIGLDNASQPSCPDSSKIGSVEVDTPLLEHPLEGSVFLAQQGNLPGNGSNPFGSLLALYLVAEGSGALVKLTGEVSLDPVTGQLTVRFGEDPVRTRATGERQFLPQLPFSDLKMSFFGGPRAPLITPSGCGSYTTSSQLTPWSGNAPAEPSSAFTIGAGCGGGFKPSFTAGTTNNRRARSAPSA